MKRLVWLLVVLLAAGCVKGPGSESGPKHKWFNPYGQQVEDVIPDTCSPAELQPPADTPPPSPPEGAIPAGWYRAVYTLQVEAVKVDYVADPIFDVEYCIPVSVHVYVTAAGIPGEVVEFDSTGVTLHTMPWDGLRNTPWRSSITVAWDPKSTAPVMNFDLSARYERGDGLGRAPVPKGGAMVGLLCSIRQGPVTLFHQASVDIFRTDAADPGLPNAVFGPFVHCRPPAFTAIPL